MVGWAAKGLSAAGLLSVSYDACRDFGARGSTGSKVGLWAAIC